MMDNLASMVAFLILAVSSSMGPVESLCGRPDKPPMSLPGLGPGRRYDPDRGHYRDPRHPDHRLPRDSARRAASAPTLRSRRPTGDRFYRRCHDDLLEDTVDCALLTLAVARTVELESYRRLERLADRIAGICVRPAAVTSAEVKVRKLRPPMAVSVGAVALTLRRAAADEDGARRQATSHPASQPPI